MGSRAWVRTAKASHFDISSPDGALTLPFVDSTVQLGVYLDGERGQMMQRSTTD